MTERYKYLCVWGVCLRQECSLLCWLSTFCLRTTSCLLPSALQSWRQDSANCIQLKLPKHGILERCCKLEEALVPVCCLWISLWLPVSMNITLVKLMSWGQSFSTVGSDSTYGDLYQTNCPWHLDSFKDDNLCCFVVSGNATDAPMQFLSSLWCQLSLTWQP